jgi:hypothetical protein
MLAKPPRSGARKGGLEAVAASWTIGSEEYGFGQHWTA